MKTQMTAVAVVAVLVAMVGCKKENKGLTPAEVAAQTAAVIQAQNKSGRIDTGNPSPELLDVAKADPELVMAFLILEEAKGFPGVARGLEQEVLATASREGSVAALAKVRKSVDDGLNKAIADSGKKPENHRIGWINNNPATALLFLEWPVAERLGKKSEFLVAQLKGTYRQEPYWHAPITLEQMAEWWWGKWPFEGEKSPLE